MQLNKSASVDSSLLKPLLLISPFFLWGTAMVAMKGVIPHTTPFFLAGMRILPAGILILIAAAIMGKPQPKGWKAWLWIALFGLVDGALFQGFLAAGLVRTGAGLGSVMIDSQPLAVALMCSWLFAERIGLYGYFGLILGILGISIIGLPDELILSIFSSNSDFVFPISQSFFQSGELLMLLAALSMAVGTVMIRFVIRHVDPITATGWHMILGGLPLWGISATTESQQIQNLIASDWLALGYATIFGSAIAYGMFFYFASSGNLTSLSSLTFLTPIFALIFGSILLNESLSALQWVGVAITLASIYLINQRDVLDKRNQLQPLHIDGDILPQTTTQSTLEISQNKLNPLKIKVMESETEILH
ncbi:DMT family transporter [Plectonema cf. radiosum LEGE 06105]|uniref:DMT family transporter n=1 Tax=Plectonema cf. radiosum LEGE 06105 TaxID=945769 RepID=A0A8J7JVC4_9CYAN|nr:DMT family transporter [Plectonema radiosum]MBE9214450.1 DMT family transporter [Plectonema cf. radiosum LEGE 06105]